MRTGRGDKDGHADPNDVRGIIVSVLREAWSMGRL